MHTLFQRNLSKLTEIVTWWDFMFYALYEIDWSYCVSDLSKQTVKAVSCKPSHEKQHGKQRKRKGWADRERGGFLRE